MSGKDFEQMDKFENAIKLLEERYGEADKDNFSK